MAQEFADAYGGDAGEVFLTLCTFLKTLAYASRGKSHPELATGRAAL